MLHARDFDMVIKFLRTIAAKPPPSSKELLKRKSSFTVPFNQAKSTSGQDIGKMLFFPSIYVI